VLGLVRRAGAATAENLGELVVKTTAAGARRCTIADVGPRGHSREMARLTTVTANGKQAVLIYIARQPSSNTHRRADLPTP